MAAKIYMPSSSACKLKHYQFPARLVSLVAASHAHSMAWCHSNPVVHLGGDKVVRICMQLNTASFTTA